MLEHAMSLADQTSAAVQNTGTWLEKLALGGGVMVLGLSIVFLGLISLIIITLVYPKIAKALIARSSAKKEKAAVRKQASTKTEKAAVLQKTAVSVATAKAADDDALIAVITAAVAASLGASSNGVVIKSIERTGQNVPAWGARGRIEQVYNRL